MGGFLLQPGELSALPFCDNGVGERCAGEGSRAEGWFKILLLPTVLREPCFAFGQVLITWFVKRGFAGVLQGILL